MGNITTQLYEKLCYRQTSAEIIFTHIPKCGGTSLIANLKTSAHEAKRSFGIESLDIDSISTLSGDNSEKFWALSMDLFSYKCITSRANLLTAHAPVSRAIMDNASPEKKWITLLRNPIKRWISNYTYDRYKHGGVGKHSMKIDEFLTSPQSKYYSSYYQRFFNDNRLVTSESDADKVIDFICDFDIVGLTEHYSAFCSSLSEIVGFPIESTKENESPNKRESSALEEDSNLISKLKELCEMDLYIYEGCISRMASKTP